jgi:hypothetical protein
MEQVDEERQRLLDDGVRTAPFHMHDEPDAARIVLVSGVVKSLFRWQS